MSATVGSLPRQDAGASAPAVPRIDLPWYLRPRVLSACMLLPLYIIAWFVTDVLDVQVSNARGYAFFHGEAFLIGLAGVLALVYGTFLPIRIFSIRDPRYRGLEPPLWFIYVIGAMALVGYSFWFGNLLRSPGVLLDLLRSAASLSFTMRTQLERSAGISSLASLGLAFFVLVAHRVWTLRAGPLPRALRVMAWLLGALTLFRAFAWAERLALIEVGVVVALFCFGHGDMTRPLLRRIRQALPLLAATSVIGFFALAEFDRSWSSHYAAIESSYGSFIAQRLVNYYYQALNNGAGMITVMDWPSYQFSNLLHWLHQFPVLLGPIVRYLTTARPNDFLERFGDPEFSNSSGLFAVFYDAGLPFGILLLAVFGCLAQSAYQAFRERDNVMGLLFPVFFMGLIEFFRFWYIGNSRAFLLIVALLLAIVLARQRMRPDRSTST